MPDDGGFEREVVNNINKTKDNEYRYKAYRRKQHRFSSQVIDVLVDSDQHKYYCGIECKSTRVDYEKDAESESKLYFSQAFSENKNGVHQVERITEFLKKTGRNGFLAIAYRRGRGKKVLQYGLNWTYVNELYKEGYSGIPKDKVEEYGFKLDDYTEFFNHSTLEK